MVGVEQTFTNESTFALTFLQTTQREGFCLKVLVFFWTVHAVKSFSEIKKGRTRYKSPYVQVSVDVSQIFQYVREWYNNFIFQYWEHNYFVAIYKTRG